MSNGADESREQQDRKKAMTDEIHEQQKRKKVMVLTRSTSDRRGREQWR